MKDSGTRILESRTSTGHSRTGEELEQIRRERDRIYEVCVTGRKTGNLCKSIKNVNDKVIGPKDKGNLRRTGRWRVESPDEFTVTEFHRGTGRTIQDSILRYKKNRG